MGGSSAATGTVAGSQWHCPVTATLPLDQCLRLSDSLKSGSQSLNLALSLIILPGRPKLFQAFSVKFTLIFSKVLIFFHKCVHSIIPHQHMYKLCILMQHCDLEHFEKVV